MRELKVYGGLAFMSNGKQSRIIIAATSRKAASEGLQKVGLYVPVSHITGYWSITGNAKEIEIALLHPLAPFLVEEYGKEITEYKP